MSTWLEEAHRMAAGEKIDGLPGAVGLDPERARVCALISIAESLDEIARQGQHGPWERLEAS